MSKTQYPQKILKHQNRNGRLQLLKREEKFTRKVLLKIKEKLTTFKHKLKKKKNLRK